jgi:hypothetical protein
MNEPTPLIDGIVGNWHLVDLDANEVALPQHRVDLVIRRTESGLTGAVLSRIDGRDVTWAALVVQFDASTLRLQMQDTREPNPVEAPWLVMVPTNDRFEGRWHYATSEPIGPTLKLVRARN